MVFYCLGFPKRSANYKFNTGVSYSCSNMSEETSTLSVATAHDDFNWEQGKRSMLAYSEVDRLNYDEKYTSSMTSVQAGTLVKGVVSAIGHSDVVLDINHKSDGLISLSDCRDMPDLKVGDKIEVYIEKQEDGRGQLVLSRRKAKILRAWENIVDSFKNGTVIRGTVISKTKGGLIVDTGGLETFLPGSQIDIKPVMDYDQYVGKVMEFKVVKVNETIKNAVVSHKTLIESDLAEQREQIISHLEKGQVLEGVVKNITDFGAFLDLGGVDGLLYITDISWGRITHPSEVLHMNQKINVCVLDFDEGKKRISLGLKQLTSHPWDVLEAEVGEGSVVKGKVVNIEDYGAFIEIRPGVEGLVHISEVTWSNQPINAREYFKLGHDYEAKVVTIDRGDKKMSLSIKQLTSDPWVEIEGKYAAGSRHTGEVKNITQYGVFVELEDGVGGMIHISDLSWTKRYQHPNEFTKVGQHVEVLILDIDAQTRKLALGHKQVEEDPWSNFDAIFTQGSLHEGTVLRRDDRGAIIQLPHGLEAFASKNNIKKEDGSFAEVGEILTFKVIDFDGKERKIILSHSRFVEDKKRDAEMAIKRENQAADQAVTETVQKINSESKASTIGDLLKEQMDK
jgi:small subunit ribosomal protein S1